jgi:hypothetical protein
MCGRLAFSVALLTGALILVGAAQGTLAVDPRFAFPKDQVSVRQRVLRDALEEVFPLSGPVKVMCRGLMPIALSAGGRGFVQIRCTTSLNIDDYLYHLDSRGRVYATRVHKR